jgi:hypothetical protein
MVEMPRKPASFVANWCRFGPNFCHSKRIEAKGKWFSALNFLRGDYEIQVLSKRIPAEESCDVKRWSATFAMMSATGLIGGCMSPDGPHAQETPMISAPSTGSIFPAAKAVEARLSGDPAYAGAVIRDAPTPEAVFALTKDAERKVRELTPDPRIRGLQVKYSLKQLEEIQAEAGNRIASGGGRFRVITIDVLSNSVLVSAEPKDHAKLQQLLSGLPVRVID